MFQFCFKTFLFSHHSMPEICIIFAFTQSITEKST